MSWFSSIAGKAEQILNQLDEAAATSLKDAGISTPNKTTYNTNQDQTHDQTTGDVHSSTHRSLLEHSTEHSSGLSYEPIAQPTATPTRPLPKPVNTSVSSTWSSSPSSWSRPVVGGSRSFSSVRDQTNDDNSLMDFLNSPTLPHEKKKATPITATTRLSDKRVKSRKSEDKRSHDMSHDSSMDEAPPILPLSHTPTSNTCETTPTYNVSDATPTVISLQPSQDNKTDQPVEQVQLSTNNNDTIDGGGEQINEENRRLREEIKSLTDELFIMKQQVGDSGRVEGQLRADVHSLRTQCKQLEELTNRMKSQEDDLTSALKARDSQISILRTRLQESDELTHSLRTQLEQAERKKDQFLQDVGKSNDAQNQALLSVKTQLEQNQLLLEQEKENITRLKVEYEERELLWSKEREEMSEALNIQGKELQQQQLRYSECHNTLQSSKQELQLLRKEYNDYKTKATGILQAKERLIESLRSSSSSSTSTTSDSIESILEEVRTEKYQLQSQLVNSEQVILSLRTELQELEDTNSIEHEQSLQQIKLIQEELEREKHLHLSTQDEVVTLQKELDNIKDEHIKERATFVSSLREKDTTIEELTKKVTNSSDQSDSSKRYLEERLSELTESLIEKQTNLEILSSQHNSTKLQLERAEASLAESQKRTLPSPHTALELGVDNESSSNQMRPMASMLPEGGAAVRQRHLKRVRTTLDSVDKVGLRLAWVLRRYPCVRLLTFGYILLLHVWVMIVLFTYKPEVHDHE